MDSRHLILKNNCNEFILANLIRYNLLLNIQNIPVVALRLYTQPPPTIRNRLIEIYPTLEAFQSALMATTQDEFRVIDTIIRENDKQGIMSLLRSLDYIDEQYNYNESWTVNREYIYLHVIFGKGHYRYLILKHLLGCEITGLHPKNALYGVTTERDKNILNHLNSINIALFIALYIVIQQIFSDGNHRSALYFLTLVLRIKNDKINELFDSVIPTDEQINELNHLYEHYYSMIQLISFNKINVRVESDVYMFHLLEPMVITMKHNYEHLSRVSSKISTSHYLYRFFIAPSFL